MVTNCTILYGPYEKISYHYTSIFKAEQTLYLNLAKDAIKISCLAFVAWKTYRTNGEWLQSKFDFISEKIKPFIKS